MRYTDNQGLPYPATRREMANAPLASELLARAVDAKLTLLNTAWVAEVNGPTVVLTLASNITGIAPNSDYPVFMDTIQKQVPAGWTGSNQTISAREPGWYHCFVNMQFTCEGTVTANSKREMRVEVSGSNDVFNPLLVTERWIRRDNERGGTTNLAVDFVTFLRPNYSIATWFKHDNVASVRVDAANTQVSWTKICGEV